MPLVLTGAGGTEPAGSLRDQARKVRPEYVGGELVRVAHASNLAEAELIQGILLEEGIPSVQRRMRGFDVPDFLAAGPRDVLVAEAALDSARELLAGAAIPAEGLRRARDAQSPARLAAGILVAFLGAAVLVWVLYQVSG
jgi:hypothetical protein